MKMDWVNRKWVVPLVVFCFSGTFIFASYSAIYPFLTYDTFPIGFTPSAGIKISALLAGLLLPTAVAKLYRLNSVVMTALVIFPIVLGVLLDPGNFDGNRNLGLVAYLLVYQLAATLICAALTSYLLSRKTV